MINETTWNRAPDQQTHFAWNATSEGIRLEHNNGNPSYTIPWHVFYTVFQQARNMALETNGVVTAGLSENNPAEGTVGAWVLPQRLVISNGVLTPRHLSFIGPILGRMGFITHQHRGIAIQWVFN